MAFSYNAINLKVGCHTMPLTDTKIRALKPNARLAKHGDGGGLLLIINPNGSKLWRVVYRVNGKQKQLSFGAWPDVSLAAARSMRDTARKLLAQGIDPSVQKRQDRAEKERIDLNTFEALANEFIAKNCREGKSDATLSKKRWLISLASTDLGKKPITEISAADILVPLRRAEARGNYETARRLRAVISQIFRYAIATARAENDLTFGLKGAITAPKVAHRAAVTDWDNFTKLLSAIWAYNGTPETCAALKLMALLYPHPGELR
jgi:Arm DNA-binding domain